MSTAVALFLAGNETYLNIFDIASVTETSTQVERSTRRRVKIDGKLHNVEDLTDAKEFTTVVTLKSGIQHLIPNTRAAEVMSRLDKHCSTFRPVGRTF